MPLENSNDGPPLEGDLVELKKLNPAVNPAIETGSWETYPVGSGTARTSLPVGYMLVGILLESPRVGGQVRIARLERNGVKALGVFQSSRVTGLTGDGFTTQNSVYRLKRL